MIRSVLALFLFGAISLAALSAQTSETVYHAPTGEAPPVAPPLKKGSPLDHLANDPRIAQPTVGYREGNTRGDTFYIAHRHLDEFGGQGWGWVKAPDASWHAAIWIALQETPGLAVAPHRKLVKVDADQDWEYKFWGAFTGYKAYDPRLDEQLPVFQLQGYEVIGQAAPLKIKTGPSDRVFQKPSGASSREGRPILTDPGVD